MAESCSLMKHKENLSRLCRIRGQILSDRSLSVASHLPRLKYTFREDFPADKPGVQPEYFCLQCFAAISNSERRGTLDARKAMIWSPHAEECAACNHINMKQRVEDLRKEGVLVDQKNKQRQYQKRT